VSPAGAAPLRLAGFTLLDLLIALTLGLVLVAAVVQVFGAGSRSYAVAMSQARMAENARVALEMMAYAARAAGYLGCNSRPADLVKGLVGDWREIPEYDVTRAAEGYGASGDGWQPALDSLPITEGRVNRNVHWSGHGIDTRRLARGSDVVVFRSLAPTAQRLAEPLWPGGRPVVTAPGGDPGFGAGDILLIADCLQAAIFQVTEAHVYGDRVRLRHDPGRGGSRFENAVTVDTRAGSEPFTLSGSGRPYDTDSVVGPLLSTWFFVAPGAGRDARGRIIPALWHKSGSDRPAELVQGVERLEAWFRLPAGSGDGVRHEESSSGRYVRAGDPLHEASNARAVAVRLRVTMVAVDGAGDDDRPSRRAFDRTIMLRNAAPAVAP
jgi:type IV pilus assembly protein PilW